MMTAISRTFSEESESLNTCNHNINNVKKNEITRSNNNDLKQKKDNNMDEDPSSSNASLSIMMSSSSSCQSNLKTHSMEISLFFDDFMDLQTRLVLLPYHDSDCLGAVIHSYIPINTNHNDDVKDTDSCHCQHDDQNNNTKHHNDNDDDCNNNQHRNDLHDGNDDDKSTMDASANMDDITLQSNASNGTDKHTTTTNTTTSEIQDSTTPINTRNNNHDSETMLQEECPSNHNVHVAKNTHQYQSNIPKDIAGYILTKINPTQQISKTEVNTANHDTIDKDPNHDNNDDDDVDWTTTDFSLILNTIRETSTPIVLTFQSPSTSQQYSNNNHDNDNHREESPTVRSSEYSLSDDDDEEENNNDDSSYYSSTPSSSSNNSQNDDDEEYNNHSNKKTSISTILSPESEFRGRLQRWGSQVRIQSNILAAEAAARVDRVAKRDFKMGTEQQLQTPQEQQQQPQQPQSISTQESNSTSHHPTNQSKNSNNHSNNNSYCGLFVQTTSGKCISLQEYEPDHYTNSNTNNSNNNNNNNNNNIGDMSRSQQSLKKLSMLLKSSPPIISNTSVLVIRSSIDNPCPLSGYEYQWYRSSIPYCNENCSSTQQETAQQWFALDGVTQSSFQPSAMDVGYRVKCQVTITIPKIENSTTSTTSDQTYQSSSPGMQQRMDKVVVTCELFYAIEADYTLFNSALKTFVADKRIPGKMRIGFGVLSGIDDQSKHLFRFNFDTIKASSSNSSCDDNSTEGSFEMIIFKIAGNTPEPLNSIDEPIKYILPSPDRLLQKNITLHFPTLPPSASSLQELLNNHNELILQAPNRIVRETFILTIGIALFQGKMSDLNTKTVLFPIFHRSTDILNDCDNTVEDMDESITNSTISPLDSDITPLKECNSENDRCIQYSASLEQRMNTPFSKEMLSLESEIEKDMELLRTKLESKNETVTNLQSELDWARNECEKNRVSCKLAEKRIESLESDLLRIKADYAKQINKYEAEATEREKDIKSLTNQTAVLSAAVECRDVKLGKMSNLQEEIELLKRKVEEGDKAKQQLNELNMKYELLQNQCEDHQANERKQQAKEKELQIAYNNMTKMLSDEKKKSLEAQAEITSLSSKCQELRTEKNFFKQKADSLSKEISRICRNGMGVGDIEKLIHDYELISTEVSVLKAQKRKVTSELQECRKAYEDTARALSLATSDVDAVRALEQRAELERVISELTEYVHAKDMQLETMRDVNRALTEEIRLMAKSNLGKHDV